MLRRMMMAGAEGPSGNIDNFDADSRASYTQYAETAVTLSISGGALTASGGAGNQSVIARNGVTFLNGEVGCEVRQANDAGLALRVQDKSNYILAAIFDSLSGAPNRVVLYSRVGGAFSQIATATVDFPRGVKRRFTFAIAGTSAVVKMDGTTVLTATVATNTAPGMCGMRCNAGVQIFDSFTWP